MFLSVSLIVKSIKAVCDKRIKNGFGHEVWEYRNNITNLAKEIAEDIVVNIFSKWTFRMQ